MKTSTLKVLIFSLAMALAASARAESPALRAVKVGDVFSESLDEVSKKACSLKTVGTERNIERVGLQLQILLDGQEHGASFWIWEQTSFEEYLASSQPQFGTDAAGAYEDKVVARLLQKGEVVNFYLVSVRIRNGKVTDHQFQVKCLGLKK